ncbi:MAG: kelch repeat-containing protein [Verrucomicrobiota bacterium]
MGATLGGTISSDGGSATLERGVVFSPSLTNGDPVIGGPGTTLRVADTTGTGAFTVSVTALVPGTDYTFKAYATNSLGTGYSDAATFRTAANQRPSITVTGGLVRHFFTGRLAVPRLFHTVSLLADGSVLAAGGSTGNIVGLTSTEIYHPSTGLWTTGANMSIQRAGHNATLLASGRLLVSGGFGIPATPRSVEIFNPATGSWSTTASMAKGRSSHTSTLLGDGRVLVTGGLADSAPTNSTEIYDPATGIWSEGAPMATARIQHTATLLSNGKVLVSAGTDWSVNHSTAELFDPVTGTWAATGNMTNPRAAHTSTLLADGRVLVSGGHVVISSIPVALQTSEIYDPADGSWSATGNRVTATSGGTATLMPDGRVIAAGGGSGSGQPLDSSEIYHPATGFWDRFATLAAPRYDAPAALLPGGQLLLVGGRDSASSGILSSTELLGPVVQLAAGAEGLSVSRTGTFSDPEGNGTVTLSASAGTISQDNAAGTWNWTGTRNDGPADAVVTITATDSFNASGSVAISFPVTNAVPALAISGPPSAVIGSSVDFTFTASDPSPADQAAGFSWSVNFGDGTAPVTVAAGIASPMVRSHSFANSGLFNVTATATDKDGGVSLTASHQVTIGGPPSIIPFNYPTYSATTLSAAAKVLSEGGYAVTERGIVYSPAATNANPQFGGAGVLSLTSTSLGTGPFTLTLTNLTPNTTYRYRFYAVNAQGTGYSLVQSFTTTGNHPPLLGLNGATGIFAPTGSMLTPRREHTATLLPDGKVLVAGGSNYDGFLSLGATELYDPATGQWAAAGDLVVGRRGHTATRLADGNVLVVGGYLKGGDPMHRLAEIFESATGTWLPTGNLAHPRRLHTATLLLDGQVLIAGGGTSSAELYNPATGLWTPVGNLATARNEHTATLLADGRVLITGGIPPQGGNLITTSEIFDPTTRTWSAATSATTGRIYHTADLLANGKVYVSSTRRYTAGGLELGGGEIYDPATNSWAAGASPVTPRSEHTSTLLPDGKLLFIGGYDTSNQQLGDAESYDPITGQWTSIGTGAITRWRPTATLLASGKVLIAGGLETTGPTVSAELYDRQTTAAGLEGSPISQSGTFYDAEGNTTVTLTASSGTLTQDNAAGTWAWTAMAGDGPASSSVTVTATDSLNGATNATFTLNVANAVPVAAIAAPGSGEAGTPLNFTFTAADPSPADEAAGFSWTLNFGDGTPPESIPPGTASPLSRVHAFNLAGIFTVTVTATDKDGGQSSVASHVVSITGPPVVQSPASSGITSIAAVLGGAVFYDGGAPMLERGVVYSMTTQNNLPGIGGPGVTKLTIPNNATSPFSANALDLTPGTDYSFRAYAINGKGTGYTSLATFTTVANSAPVLGVNGTTATRMEGNSITHSGTFSDSEGNATATLAVSFGAITQNNGAGTWNWTAMAGDGPASSAVTVTATDSLNSATNATFTLNVANAVPVAGIAGPAAGDTGSSLNYTFTATDPSPADVAAGFAWTFNFGDGTGTQSVPAGTASPLIRSHAFGSPGTFTITVSATDKDSGLSTVASQVVSITGPPVVDLPVSSGITSIAATLGGRISQNGGFPLTEGGVVYSITALNDQPVVGGTGVTKLTNPVNSTGSFSTNAVNLTPGTSYSFRAYAANSKGTGYSSLATFTTAANRAPVLAVNGAGITPVFTPTSNLATARAFHMAALLGNGKVVVAGGSSGTGAAFLSAEVYDPATGRWTATANLTVARDSPKAVLLPNGKVFVTGGTGTGGSLGSTELYDPAAGTWTPAASMASPRYSHSAILLADGKVLVTGGQSDNGYLAGAEIYDPVDGTWTATGSLAIARFAHTATLLPDGRVLVTGGHGTGSTLSNAEIYDPATGQWTPTGSMAAARRYHTETLLPHGKVLVTGGQSSLASSNYLDSTEIYDPAAGTWTPGATLPGNRYRHTAVLLRDNKVLIAGGYAGSLPIASTALYDPASNLWSAAASLTVGRLTQTATLLADGRVLVAGGNGSFLSNPLASTEIYAPPAPVVSVEEGLTVTKTGTFSDPEGNTTAILTVSYGTVTQNNAAGTWSWTATGEDGPATSSVIVTAMDTLGGVSRATFAFSVTNRPPTAEITGPAVAAAGVPVGFTFTAADPAAPDQAAGFAWGLSYGDGTAFETAAAGTASPLGRSHTFSSAGTFTVTASATDKNSGKGTSLGKTITVFSGLQGWRLSHFGSINDGGNAASLFDADGDGLVNLAEFAFGLNPNSGASAQLPAAQRIGSNLVVTFPEPPGVAGSVIYRAEWSPDLSSGNWLPVSDSGTGGTHTFSVPMADRTKAFIRLVVTEG